MAKTKCELDKKEYKESISDTAVFYCKKCDRRAEKEKHLCKPKKIKD